MRRELGASAIALLGMGTAVAASWLAIGIRGDSFGLDPASLLRPSRLAIYAIQLLLVGLIGYGLARASLPDASIAALAAIMAAAWVGEGLVLTAVGRWLVANEINPLNAWYFWLVATAGPIQPLVATLGGVLGRRRST